MAAKRLRDELLDAFIIEAQDQIQELIDTFLELETCDDARKRQELVERAYRDLHSLKGNARAISFKAIEKVCHPLEGVLDALKTKGIVASREMLDLLLGSVRSMEGLLADPNAKTVPEALQATINELLAQIQDEDLAVDIKQRDFVDEYVENIWSVALLPQSGDEQADPREKGERDNPTQVDKRESLRVETRKLERIIQHADEMLSIKSFASQHLTDTEMIRLAVGEMNRMWTKAAPEIKHVQRLMAGDYQQSHLQWSEVQSLFSKVSDLIDKNHQAIKTLCEDVNALSVSADRFSYSASVAIDSLMDETKRLIMMPFSTICESFPVLVRSLARELRKEVTFTMSGTEIELDKRILNEIKDPLIHLLRNSIDHGIESPEQRTAKGKPATANLTLSVHQPDARTLKIRVTDDGDGINTERVRATALDRRLKTSEELERMSESEIHNLILHSSFSTSNVVTEISGRGLGLAIVEEKVRLLGGKIELASTRGRGMETIMTLPVTIATVRGVFVKAGFMEFVLPASSIDKVALLKKSEICPVGQIDTMILGDAIIPVCELKEILQLPEGKNTPNGGEERLRTPGAGADLIGYAAMTVEPTNVSMTNSDLITVCVLGLGDSRIGIVVDDVLDEQDVLVKPLGAVLAGTRNISGVTIDGKGRLVPVLNVYDITSSGRERRKKTISTVEQEKTDSHSVLLKKRILLVEDSFTARILLSNLLESAGYLVKTAVDGADAINTLRNEVERVDLVITDIEMPNIDGFELTTTLRNDAKYCEIPIIIVTSKSSREYRERGVRAGANAFFVKSGFDQTNLMDVIASLI